MAAGLMVQVDDGAVDLSSFTLMVTVRDGLGTVTASSEGHVAPGQIELEGVGLDELVAQVEHLIRRANRNRPRAARR